MDRRNFVFGSIQAAVVFGMANSVKALPSLDFDIKPDRVRELASSHIFSYADFKTKIGEQAGILIRTEYPAIIIEWPVPFVNGEWEEIAMRIEIKKRDDARMISSTVRGTEFRYINASPVIVSEHRTNSKQACFEIVRAANSIGRETRRGRGNHIIVSPRFRNPFLEYIGMPLPNLNIIRDHGIGNGGLVADNVAYIFYRGQNKFDVPGVLFQDGAIALNRDFKGNEFGYGRKLIFTGDIK